VSVLLRQSKVMIWIALSILAVVLFYAYSQYNKYYPGTDNAYVGANIVQISPQVTGPIATLYVKNFAAVKKDQPLFDIDPATFQVAVDEAQSELEVAQQNVKALKNTIKALEALVTQRQSEVTLAEATYKRISELVKRRQISLADGDKSLRDVQVTTSALAEAKDKLQEAIEQLGSGDENNAQIRTAEARLAQAKLNLSYTKVLAPVSGHIANLTAGVGAMVQRGVSLFSIVDSKQWWVDANFKETELQRIRVGQPVTVKLDIYPDHVFHGEVQSISRGSGAAFSIFPAENATGNWVKITQRFPVRVYITDPDPAFPLRIGASAAVEIDTTK
jgi:membrane fusion protein, multidrug efflux system